MVVLNAVRAVLQGGQRHQELSPGYRAVPTRLGACRLPSFTTRASQAGALRLAREGGECRLWVDDERLAGETRDGRAELDSLTPGVPPQCNRGGFRYCMSCSSGGRDAWMSVSWSLVMRRSSVRFRQAALTIPGWSSLSRPSRRPWRRRPSPLNEPTEASVSCADGLRCGWDDEVPTRDCRGLTESHIGPLVGLVLAVRGSEVAGVSP